MEFEKRTVPLSAIEPSGANPREEFGDIAALAETIRATGGEPVNPPVVVADGNVFRIVDGERRYRALREIYGREPGRRVNVLVAGGMDEANELVAMLATDDKQGLTEAERSRGVQQMLILGVDTERAARAARAGREQVRAMARMAPRAPEGVQVTLDQALAASRLPDDLAEAVLAAGDGWRGAAREAERKVEAERFRAELAEAAREAGWEIADGVPPSCRYIGPVRSGRVREDATLLSGKGARVAVISPVNSVAWVYAPVPEREAPEVDGEAEERRRLRDEDAAACLAMANSMARHMACGEFPASRPDLVALALDVRREEIDERFGALAALDPEVADAMDAQLRSLPFSQLEVEYALMRDVNLFCGGTWESFGRGRDRDALEALAEAYDLMSLAGWEPSESDRAKRAEAADAMDGDDE